MDRDEALAILNKATNTTTTAAGALVDPDRARSFLEGIVPKSRLAQRMRTEVIDSGATSGTIDKITVGEELIRPAPENDDDGYRAEVGFDSVAWDSKKIRLPWEVTNDLYRRNKEKRRLERRITDNMQRQWARDLASLNINGNTAGQSADPLLPDYYPAPRLPFIKIDDGLLKLTAAGSGAHVIDGAAVSASFDKDHLFAMLEVMPVQYLSEDAGETTGGGQSALSSFDLVWLANPRVVQWWTEYLTDRPTAAGDAALSRSGSSVNAPLGIPWLSEPKMPLDTIILTPPKNLVRILTTEMIRYAVSANTDWELAVRDKNGYVFFLNAGFTLDEIDAVVRLDDLPAPA
jgi:hypothetical protein